MEIIDFIAAFGVACFFIIWAFDMFGPPIFTSPALPTSFGSILTVIGGTYFLTGGNPWITGAYGLLAVGYYITSFALKGSK